MLSFSSTVMSLCVLKNIYVSRNYHRYFCWKKGELEDCLYRKKESEVAQSCPSLCDPMDCSPPGSSTHGILQARVLEWVAVSFSRGSAQPRDRTRVSHIPGRRLNLWATREAPRTVYHHPKFEKLWLKQKFNRFLCRKTSPMSSIQYEYALNPYHFPLSLSLFFIFIFCRISVNVIQDTFSIRNLGNTTEFKDSRCSWFNHS